MKVTYNFDRPLAVRESRFAELDRRRVNKKDAKYVVITNRDAYYGTHEPHGGGEHYFKSLSTARAWAQHYSDLCDHVAGIFVAPRFVEGVSCR